MLIEDQRFIHEDLERLEQGIADRIAEEPKNVRETASLRRLVANRSQIRDHLKRDHEIAGFLDRIHDQSKRLLDIYNDTEGVRAKETQNITTGDPFDLFYKELEGIKDFHRRYPNEPVENLERAYKRRNVGEEAVPSEVDNMFTGEEGFGRFLDLTIPHEAYLNLQGVKRLTYLQYLDNFDAFTPPQLPLKRSNKLSDQYFKYIGNLAEYLESFIKRTKPLEDLYRLFATYDAEFEKQWSSKTVPGWEEETNTSSNGPQTEGTGAGTWCPACEKEFTNDNVYRNHLTGKKHIRAAEALKARGDDPSSSSTQTTPQTSITKLKERAIAEREHRIRSLTQTLHPERLATRTNIERKQGMTERERQMELDAFFAESADPDSINPNNQNNDSDNDSDTDEKFYNPLKLPLAWDGKPIPYWLYKLHGLGVEFPCEICGNFVYMGRRAFDKHFSENKHTYRLKCLGITAPAALFREITGIQDALRLWEKMEAEKKREKEGMDNVVQMEDAEGNVMPEKIYLEYVFSFLCF